MLTRFDRILALALEKKGGQQALSALLPDVASVQQLKAVSDDRYLAQMTRCVFNAGFHWRVITAKWEGFEAAFYRFDLGRLLTQSPDEWEAYKSDERIVRNWQKIQTVFENACMIDEIAQEHGSFAAYFADYPADRQVALMRELKQRGSRLGGKTAQWFIRFAGKDGFVLSNDVIAALIANGVDIDPRASSQKDLNTIQAAFNQWHEETALPFTHLSKILSYTAGDNIPADVLLSYVGRQSVR